MDREDQATEKSAGTLSGAPGNPLEELLTSARIHREGVTVRDDLYDEAQLLDAVRLSRRGGRRFRLVDSGRLDRLRLEWLLEAGADFYTTDEFRTDLEELEGLLQAAGKGRSILAYFVHAPFPQEEEGVESAPQLLSRLGRTGGYLHVSDRENARDPDMLLRLAEECESGGSHLVYYHHSPFGPELIELIGASLWFHLDEQSLSGPEMQAFFLDVLRSSRSRARFVLFSEGKSDAVWLKEILAAGVYVRFHRKQFDYRSPLRPLENAAAKKKLPHTAYYLHPIF
ncbi:MAG: hypothetical protein WBB73_00550 [Candidatus Aminicenantaceae bacterium]